MEKGHENIKIGEVRTKNIFDTVKDLEFIHTAMESVDATEITLSKDTFDEVLRHLKAYEKLYIESSWDKSPERMGGC